MEQYQKEIINIIEVEINISKNENYINFLRNEIERYYHKEHMKEMEIQQYPPPMNKLPVNGSIQTRINYLKNLQYLYLYHYNNNKNISGITIEMLDKKINSTYKKIGKLIKKKDKFVNFLISQQIDFQ